MKKLHANGQIIEADRMVKTADEIYCYLAGIAEPIAAFTGISDFSGYALEEDAAWDIPVPSPEERLAAIESAMLALL